MGCDIHMFVEVQVNNRWEHYGQLTVNRDYKLFAKLAGVRRNGDDHSAILGRLDPLIDINPLTALHMANPDYHTPGWCAIKEVRALLKWMDKQGYTWQNCNLREEIEFLQEVYPKTPWRLVFAFDN